MSWSICVGHFFKTLSIIETQGAFRTHFTINRSRYAPYRKSISRWMANFVSMGAVTEPRSPSVIITMLVRRYANTSSFQCVTMRFFSICLFGVCREFCTLTWKKSVIFKPSFSFLLIYFILLTFPSASCWIFLCNFTGFLAIFKVVTSTLKMHP